MKEEIKRLFSFEASLFSFSEQSQLLKKDLSVLEDWLANKHHGQMEFMSKNIDARTKVEHILPNTQTALVFLIPYSHGHRVRRRLQTNITSTKLSAHKNSLIGKRLISKYVYGKDYHKIIKVLLEDEIRKLESYLGTIFSYRIVVDSIPFLERAHAREADLGFIGKNTMLIRPGTGSFFFIASVLTTLPASFLSEKIMKKSKFNQIDCGSCNLCVEACPTQALLGSRTMDARRCLSYLTIEHRGPIEDEYLPHFQNTIYGCDICQDVCPYNSVTLDVAVPEKFSHPHEPFTIISPYDVATMSFQDYQKWFGGTAATRAKFQGLKRNALYHLLAIADQNVLEICDQWISGEDKTLEAVALQVSRLVFKKINHQVSL